MIKKNPFFKYNIPFILIFTIYISSFTFSKLFAAEEEFTLVDARRMTSAHVGRHSDAFELLENGAGGVDVTAARAILTGIDGVTADVDIEAEAQQAADLVTSARTRLQFFVGVLANLDAEAAELESQLTDALTALRGIDGAGTYFPDGDLITSTATGVLAFIQAYRDIIGDIASANGGPTGVESMLVNLNGRINASGVDGNTNIVLQFRPQYIPTTDGGAFTGANANFSTLLELHTALTNMPLIVNA